MLQAVVRRCSEIERRCFSVSRAEDVVIGPDDKPGDGEK